jgi:hypothetical protein
MSVWFVFGLIWGIQVVLGLLVAGDILDLMPDRTKIDLLKRVAFSAWVVITGLLGLTIISGILRSISFIKGFITKPWR